MIWCATSLVCLLPLALYIPCHSIRTCMPLMMTFLNTNQVSKLPTFPTFTHQLILIIRITVTAALVSLQIMFFVCSTCSSNASDLVSKIGCLLLALSIFLAADDTSSSFAMKLSLHFSIFLVAIETIKFSNKDFLFLSLMICSSHLFIFSSSFSKERCASVKRNPIYFLLLWILQGKKVCL